MNKLLCGLTAVALLAGASGASAGNAEAKGEHNIERMVNGRVAGQPVACIDVSRAYTTEIIDKTAVLYRMSGGQVYVNRPVVGAEELTQESALWRRTGVAPLCSSDLVAIYGGGRFASNAVVLGQFVPYTRVAH